MTDRIGVQQDDSISLSPTTSADAPQRDVMNGLVSARLLVGGCSLLECFACLCSRIVKLAGLQSTALM